MKTTVGFFGLEFECDVLAKVSFELTNSKPAVGTAYHLVNAYTLVMANESPRLFLALQEGKLLCDSRPLSRILQRRESALRQIRGTDLMKQVLSEEGKSTRHFFLGSTDHVLNQLISFAKERNPRFELAGYHAPPFSDDYSMNLPSWIKMIRESDATVVWVGLGTPKQDFVAYELARNVSAHVLAVGAAFDYLSGNMDEAPRLLQKMSLEWLYRLVKEPKRLARRYLVGNFKFLIIVMKEMKKN